MKEAIKGSVESGFHPKGSQGLRSTADHELAHQLDDLFGLSSNPVVRSLYQRHSERWKREAASAYATKNIQEFIAEAWAEFKNTSNPRPIAKEIGNLILGFRK